MHYLQYLCSNNSVHSERHFYICMSVNIAHYIVILANFQIREYVYDEHMCVYVFVCVRVSVWLCVCMYVCA
jgi:hypothetical protein